MYKIHTEHYLVIYNNKCCPTRHGNLHHSVFLFGTKKKRKKHTGQTRLLFTKVLIPRLLQCFFFLIISWCMLNRKIYLFFICLFYIFFKIVIFIVRVNS